MTYVKLIKNNNVIRSFQFFDLLEGLVWIFRNGIDFDVLRVDDDTVVSKCQFRRYLETVNNYYKRVYGVHYELEE